MATSYGSVSLDTNICEELDFEVEIDTDEIASEVLADLDIEDKVAEALSEPDCVVALAQGIIDLERQRVEYRTRNRELTTKNEELTTRLKALESELSAAGTSTNGVGS